MKLIAILKINATKIFTADAITAIRKRQLHAQKHMV